MKTEASCSLDLLFRVEVIRLEESGASGPLSDWTTSASVGQPSLTDLHWTLDKYTCTTRRNPNYKLRYRAGLVWTYATP